MPERNAKIASHKTRLGLLRVVCEDGQITQVDLFAANNKALVGKEEVTLVHKEAFLQMDEYLEGKRKQFSLPLAFKGTNFQQRVWQALETIPYGTTVTYGDIAKTIGSPKGARAVGMACNRNPIAVIVPCHRVVGSTGSLTGYASGLDHKAELLSLEGCTLH